MFHSFFGHSNPKLHKFCFSDSNTLVEWIFLMEANSNAY